MFTNSQFSQFPVIFYYWPQSYTQEYNLNNQRGVTATESIKNSFKEPVLQTSEKCLNESEFKEISSKKFEQYKHKNKKNQNSTNSKSINKGKKIEKPNPKNENRNILPNSIHQIMSFVLKKHKSGTLISKIFQSLCSNSDWNVDRYYRYQKNLRQKMNYYLKESSLKMLTAIHDPKSEIYSLEEQYFYMKVSRILAKHYINSQSIPLFLTSRRMALQKKLEHFKNRRHLLQKFHEILSDN